MKKETAEEIQAREMVEAIATNISQLSRQVTALLTGRLHRKAILILLSHSTGLPQSTVNKVLEALEDMEKVYLKK